MERVDTLRYAWEKLSTLAVRSTCKACSIQVQELVYIIIGINVKLSCDFTATLIYFGGKCMKGVRREQVYHAKSGPGDRFWLPKVVLPCQKWYYLVKCGTTLPKVVLPCQKWYYLAKVVLPCQKWYYLAKSGTTLPKVVLPCQKWSWEWTSFGRQNWFRWIGFGQNHFLKTFQGHAVKDQCKCNLCCIVLRNLKISSQCGTILNNHSIQSWERHPYWACDCRSELGCTALLSLQPSCTFSSQEHGELAIL